MCNHLIKTLANCTHILRMVWIKIAGYAEGLGDNEIGSFVVVL